MVLSTCRVVLAVLLFSVLFFLSASSICAQKEYVVSCGDAPLTNIQDATANVYLNGTDITTTNTSSSSPQVSHPCDIVVGPNVHVNFISMRGSRFRSYRSIVLRGVTAQTVRFEDARFSPQFGQENRVELDQCRIGTHSAAATSYSAVRLNGFDSALLSMHGGSIIVRRSEFIQYAGMPLLNLRDAALISVANNTFTSLAYAVEIRGSQNITKVEIVDNKFLSLKPDSSTAGTQGPMIIQNNKLFRHLVIRGNSADMTHSDAVKILFILSIKLCVDFDRIDILANNFSMRRTELLTATEKNFEARAVLVYETQRIRELYIVNNTVLQVGMREIISCMINDMDGCDIIVVRGNNLTISSSESTASAVVGVSFSALSSPPVRNVAKIVVAQNHITVSRHSASRDTPLGQSTSMRETFQQMSSVCAGLMLAGSKNISRFEFMENRVDVSLIPNLQQISAAHMFSTPATAELEALGVVEIVNNRFFLSGKSLQLAQAILMGHKKCTGGCGVFNATGNFFDLSAVESLEVSKAVSNPMMSAIMTFEMKTPTLMGIMFKASIPSFIVERNFLTHRPMTTGTVSSFAWLMDLEENGVIRDVMVNDNVYVTEGEAMTSSISSSAGSFTTAGAVFFCHGPATATTLYEVPQLRFVNNSATMLAAEIFMIWLPDFGFSSSSSSSEKKIIILDNVLNATVVRNPNAIYSGFSTANNFILGMSLQPHYVNFGSKLAFVSFLYISGITPWNVDVRRCSAHILYQREQDSASLLSSSVGGITPGECSFFRFNSTSPAATNPVYTTKPTKTLVTSESNVFVASCSHTSMYRSDLGSSLHSPITFEAVGNNMSCGVDFSDDGDYSYSSVLLPNDQQQQEGGSGGKNKKTMMCTWLAVVPALGSGGGVGAPRMDATLRGNSLVFFSSSASVQVVPKIFSNLINKNVAPVVARFPPVLWEHSFLNLSGTPPSSSLDQQCNKIFLTETPGRTFSTLQEQHTRGLSFVITSSRLELSSSSSSSSSTAATKIFADNCAKEHFPGVGTPTPTREETLSDIAPKPKKPSVDMQRADDMMAATNAVQGVAMAAIALGAVAAAPAVTFNVARTQAVADFAEGAMRGSCRAFHDDDDDDKTDDGGEKKKTRTETVAGANSPTQLALTGTRYRFYLGGILGNFLLSMGLIFAGQAIGTLVLYHFRVFLLPSASTNSNSNSNNNNCRGNDSRRAQQQQQQQREKTLPTQSEVFVHFHVVLIMYALMAILTVPTLTFGLVLVVQSSVSPASRVFCVIFSLLFGLATISYAAWGVVLRNPKLEKFVPRSKEEDAKVTSSLKRWYLILFARAGEWEPIGNTSSQQDEVGDKNNRHQQQHSSSSRRRSSGSGGGGGFAVTAALEQNLLGPSSASAAAAAGEDGKKYTSTDIGYAKSRFAYAAPLVDSFTDRAPWFALVEFGALLGIVMANFISQVVPEHASCIARGALLIVVQLVYFVLVTWKRPFQALFTRTATPIAAFLQLVSFILILVVAIRVREAMDQEKSAAAAFAASGGGVVGGGGGGQFPSNPHGGGPTIIPNGASSSSAPVATESPSNSERNGGAARAVLAFVGQTLAIEAVMSICLSLSGAFVAGRWIAKFVRRIRKQRARMQKEAATGRGRDGRGRSRGEFSDYDEDEHSNDEEDYFDGRRRGSRNHHHSQQQYRQSSSSSSFSRSSPSSSSFVGGRHHHRPSRRYDAVFSSDNDDGGDHHRHHSHNNSPRSPTGTGDNNNAISSSLTVHHHQRSRANTTNNNLRDFFPSPSLLSSSPSNNHNNNNSRRPGSPTTGDHHGKQYRGDVPATTSLRRWGRGGNNNDDDDDDGVELLDLRSPVVVGSSSSSSRFSPPLSQHHHHRRRDAETQDSPSRRLQSPSRRRGGDGDGGWRHHDDESPLLRSSQHRQQQPSSSFSYHPHRQQQQQQLARRSSVVIGGASSPSTPPLTRGVLSPRSGAAGGDSHQRTEQQSPPLRARERLPSALFAQQSSRRR